MLNSFYDKFIYTSGLKYKDNNFTLINLPFMIVPVELMIALLRKDDPELGQLIYYSIKDSTEKHLLKQFDVDFGLGGEKALRFIEEFFSASGWGAINQVDLNFKKKQAIVSVQNSPFAFALKGQVKSETDHYLRGILAAAFSDLFKEKVECVETKCIALNANSCEFIIKPASELNFENPSTRRQIRID
ncbi:MAG: 4-vinyl reductase [Candidatus Diapherotrites archaeon]|nr:4-vinyl reductase [Candidatus Diapherotrites archaeon]